MTTPAKKTETQLEEEAKDKIEKRSRIQPMEKVNKQTRKHAAEKI